MQTKKKAPSACRTNEGNGVFKKRKKEKQASELEKEKIAGWSLYVYNKT